MNKKPCPICHHDDAEPVHANAHPVSLLRCRGCRTVYWHDVWDSTQVSSHYAGYYHPEAVTFDALTEQRYHATLKQVERLRPRGRLLDVGCGAGHFLAVAEARGWEAVGIEVSRSALDALNRLKRDRGFRFCVMPQELREAGFPANHFDAVALIEVLEHLDDPLPLLEETYRVLADGGLLYLTTPNYDSWSRYLLGGRWRVIAEEHRCLLNVRALEGCLVRVGFRPLRVTTKNVDVTEILARWRRQQSRRTSGPASQSATQTFRHTIERVPWLRAAKFIVNALLGLGCWGDTIEVLARKEPVACRHP